MSLHRRARSGRRNSRPGTSVRISYPLLNRAPLARRMRYRRPDTLMADTSFRRIACLVLVALASRAGAQSALLHGVVYVDANANATRDASERGVPGVMVSNQRDVVITDSLGRFEIPNGTTGIVSVSVPDGFRSSGAFW